MTVFSLSAMAQSNTEVQKLLQDPNSRTEIFNGIMNNHQMMMDNPEMMQGVMGRMMNVGEQDTTYGKRMIDVMARHPQMMNQAMQQMHNMGMQGSNQHSGTMNGRNNMDKK